MSDESKHVIGLTRHEWFAIGCGLIGGLAMLGLSQVIMVFIP